jgi:uncharacterized protein YceK
MKNNPWLFVLVLGLIVILFSGCAPVEDDDWDDDDRYEEREDDEREEDDDDEEWDD